MVKGKKPSHTFNSSHCECVYQYKTLCLTALANINGYYISITVNSLENNSMHPIWSCLAVALVSSV